MSDFTSIDDTVTVQLTDVFSREPYGGLTVGVVPEAACLTEAQQQTIVRELGGIETAFITSNESSPDQIRWDWVDTENERGDAAALAVAAYALKPGEQAVLYSETESGSDTGSESDSRRINCNADSGLSVQMDTPEASFAEIDYAAVATQLSLPAEALSEVGRSLSPGVTQAEKSFLHIPVVFLESLRTPGIQSTGISKLCQQYETDGCCLFTFDTIAAHSTLHARWFDAEGTELVAAPVAAVGCAAYLQMAEAVDSLPGTMTIEASHFAGTPSHLTVTVGDSMAVGGQVVTTLQGTIVVPSDDSDEII